MQETREEQLVKARAESEVAKDLLRRLEELRKEAARIAPPPYYSKGKTVNSWQNIVKRLEGKSQREYWLKRQFEDEDRRAAEVAKKAAEEVGKKANEAAALLYQQEAVIWLQAKGKVLGADFTLDDAGRFADDLAYTEEVARRRELGGLHDFEGQNCDGPCGGWDGVEHRCECGNRRVSWTTSWGHSFKSPSVYGEAY